MADFENTFLKIFLSEKERVCVKSLFIDDNNDLQMFKFRRIIFDINPSSFLLAATIKTHLRMYHENFPSTIQKLDICLYVDYLISAKDDVPYVFNISITVEKIMKGAGMPLKKLISNSNELMKE